jgi:hypothetical protein
MAAYAICDPASSWFGSEQPSPSPHGVRIGKRSKAIEILERAACLDENGLDRDVTALLSTGRFEDVRTETELGQGGGVIVYDPNNVQCATVAIQEFLAERGHLFATVAAAVHEIPPHSLEGVFKVACRRAPVAIC